MTPLNYYQQQIASGNFQANPLQQQAMIFLQRLYDEFTSATLRPKKKWPFKKSQQNLVKGVYLWGGVGIGKTWLMDTFYYCLPEPKLRLHFHRFMQLVHQQLQTLQGETDPLKKIAKQFAKKTSIICLDEFLVHDITDAMILANLLDALFAENITLVTTANVAPDNLYHNGLQRGRFLPAISLLKIHLETVHLTSQTDYRLRNLEQAGTYFFPLNEHAAECMQTTFKKLTHDSETVSRILEINHREITTLGYSSDIVWFDFSVICNVPRSQLDYLEIAKCFSTILISNVPHIKAEQDNIARYLINLVDVCYDTQVKLIISAAVAIDELYPEGRLSFEFKRTRSRLLEMQSLDYLKKDHLYT